MKQIIDFNKQTIPWLRQRMHAQIRKAIINFVIALILISQAGSWIDGGFWQIIVFVIAMIFALAMTVNFIRIEALHQGIRSRKKFGK
jgi:hypothetical protein